MASDESSFTPTPPDEWSPTTPEVTSATVDQVLAQSPTVAIHFWAVWDRVDRMVDESIQAVVPAFESRVHFTSCNIDLDENRELCERCNIVSIPCLAVFVDAKQRKPIIGFLPPNDLKNELEARLKNEQAVTKWWQFWKSVS